MIRKRFKIPLYYGELTIYQCDDLKVISDKYDIMDLHGYDAVVFRAPKPNGYSRYIMAFETPTKHKIIAHEALHAVGAIFEDRGIEFDYNNDEPACYLIGWIVDQCYKTLKVK